MKNLELKNWEILEIDEAKPEDAAEIIDYLKIVGGESDNLLFGSEGLPITIEAEEKMLSKIREDERTLMLVGRIDGKIATLSNLGGVGTRERIQHRASMALSVKKEFWGMGIAGKVINELISFAKKADYTVVELEVKTDNEAAIHLYEKSGFEKIGRYKNFFKINDKYYDAFYMQLILD